MTAESITKGFRNKFGTTEETATRYAMLDTASPDITTRFRNKFGTTEENGGCAVLNRH